MTDSTSCPPCRARAAAALSCCGPARLPHAAGVRAPASLSGTQPPEPCRARPPTAHSYPSHSAAARRREPGRPGAPAAWRWRRPGHAASRPGPLPSSCARRPARAPRALPHRAALEPRTAPLPAQHRSFSAGASATPAGAHCCVLHSTPAPQAGYGMHFLHLDNAAVPCAFACVYRTDDLIFSSGSAACSRRASSLASTSSFERARARRSARHAGCLHRPTERGAKEEP